MSANQSKEKKAYRLISWVLECTCREARKLCRRIEGMEASGDPSIWDIADAVLILKDGQSMPSDGEIARTAREMPLPEERKIETVLQDPEVMRFEGALSHREFIDWIDHHAGRGYVVNIRRHGQNPILHTARCSHLRPSPTSDQSITASPKLCSTDLKAIRKAATNISKKLTHCVHCEI